jgi:hypothetical protein
MQNLKMLFFSNKCWFFLTFAGQFVYMNLSTLVGIKEAISSRDGGRFRGPGDAMELGREMRCRGMCVCVCRTRRSKCTGVWGVWWVYENSKAVYRCPRHTMMGDESAKGVAWENEGKE